MNISELRALLASTGLPVQYSHFNESIKPPFVTFLQRSDDDFHADDEHYQPIMNVSVELYTAKKEPEAERKVRECFRLAQLAWQRVSETYIEDEKLYQIVWDLQLLEKE